ncbi:hypothetical protein DNTS_034502, partial [Danionella cerebrum]
RPTSRRGGGRRRDEQPEISRNQVLEQRTTDSVPHGSCETMCPVYELRQREAQKRLHRFEILPGTEQDRVPRADPSRAVKEYSRPAAGKDSTRASELRPPTVLLQTVHYLVDHVYSFVFDRLRSIRQDMIIQRVSGPECVAVLEKSVRFLLYASYRLCGEPLRYFDPRINDTQLQESLSWLLESYREGTHQHQEEFQALCLLYNLGSTQAVRHVLELPVQIRGSLPVQLALALSRAREEHNPVRMLRLARRLDFLQLCALHRHLLPRRCQLLRIYCSAHCTRSSTCRFPLQKLAGLLSLTDVLTTKLCQAHGLDVSGEWVQFSKGSFTEMPSASLQCRLMHEPLDEENWNCSAGSAIQTGA